MALINIFKRKKERRSIEGDILSGLQLGTLSWNNITGYEQTKALKLSAVYRAINLISDSVAILPIDVFQKNKDGWNEKQFNELYFLLNIRPNDLMGAQTFKKQIVNSIIMKGNAYIHITRENNKVSKLFLLNSDLMKIEIISNVKTYLYNGVRYDDADIIHIMNYSLNGLIGISTIEYASITLETTYNSELHANNFFKGGGNMSGILSPKSGVVISQKKAEDAKKAFKSASSPTSTPIEGNSIVVLDSGLDYKAISISPKNSQLLESRNFNIVTIAQYFGVSPHKLFDFSKSTYSSVELSQIDFLNTTLQPLLERIENEFYRKLFNKVEYGKSDLKFDVSNLFRLDATSQADHFTKMYGIGTYTSNEIREKLNASSPVAGGDRAFVAVNLQPLDNLIAEDPDSTDKSGQIDNKLK